MATSNTFNVTGPDGGKSLVASYFARDGVTPADLSVAVIATVREFAQTSGGGAILNSWRIECGDGLVANLKMTGTAAQIAAIVNSEIGV